jgi:predicted Zn-dependent protease with MMP-like domain
VWFTKQVTPAAAAVGAGTAGRVGSEVVATTLRAVDDRHARHRRADADPRRRPNDGFRAGSAARFERLVGDALSLAPIGLLRYLDDLEIVVDLVPPVTHPARRGGVDAEPPPLAVYEEAGGRSDARRGRAVDGQDQQAPAASDRVRLFRRPLEARARSAADLKTLVLEAVVAELADHHGLSDDDLDALGWG